MWNPYYAVAPVILAQAATSAPQTEWWSPLLNAGALGAITAWFMWRGEKKLDEQTRAQREMASALNLNAKSNMIIVLSLKNLDSNITGLAEQLKEEIEKNESNAHSAS